MQKGEKTYLLGSESETGEPPADKYSLGWIVFMMLGLGVLFPWNAFLTAYDYFSFLYPDFPFEFGISIAFNCPQIVFLLLTIKFGPRFSFSSRILIPFCIALGVLVLVPSINGASNVSRTVSLWVTLAAAFVTGCSSAVLFGSILGLAANFPPQYTGAVMSGNGVAGIVVGFLRILTKVSLPETDSGLHISTAIYFAAAAFTILLCIVAYLMLGRLEWAKHYLKIVERQRLRNINGRTDDTLPLTGSDSGAKGISHLAILHKIWKNALTVMCVFFITLTLFPGMTLEIETTGDLVNQAWFGIIMITLFQVFDFVGRTIPRWALLFTNRTLWIPTVARVLFFVLFILCIKPRVFDSDWWAFAFMSAFAVTNGYCGTLAMMYGPTNVEEHEKEVAGIVMSFFLNFGIFCAVFFALLVLYLVKGSGALQI